MVRVEVGKGWMRNNVTPMRPNAYDARLSMRKVNPAGARGIPGLTYNSGGGRGSNKLKMAVTRRHGKMLGRSVLGPPRVTRLQPSIMGGRICNRSIFLLVTNTQYLYNKI
jgi:hypothetical protein